MTRLVNVSSHHLFSLPILNTATKCHHDVKPVHCVSSAYQSSENHRFCFMEPHVRLRLIRPAEFFDLYLSKRIDVLDSRLHAFVRYEPAVARQAMTAADDEIHKQFGDDKIRWAGLLSGVTVAFQDRDQPFNLLLADRITHAGGIALAVCNSRSGITNNPHTPTHSVLGAAGGSASGMCDVALGIDVSGSVRMSSSACGVFGFCSQRKSQGGMMARSTRMIAATMDAVSTRWDKSYLHAVATRPPKSTQFVYVTSVVDAVGARIMERFNAVLEHLGRQGYKVRKAEPVSTAIRARFAQWFEDIEADVLITPTLSVLPSQE